MTQADEVARSLWGGAYESIPKAVFAVVAYHLSDCASDEGVGQGGELRRFSEELDAMQSNGILDKGHVRRARNAVKRLMRCAEPDEANDDGGS